MIDQFNREIDYLRISLTDKCNLRCIYCMPEDVENNYKINQMNVEEYKTIIRVFSKAGIKKIRFTGGEPLVYKHLEELLEFTKTICNIENICMTTNGIGLLEKIEDLTKKGLNSINISLDSLNEYKYKQITGGGNLNKVLKSLEKCIDLGLKVKINCVLIKGINDDELNDFINLAKKKDIDIRFIELMPLGEGIKFFQDGYINLNETLAKFRNLDPIKVNEKSVAQYYKIENSKGRIGIITPMSCSFCESCNRIRLTSNGSIKLCLHSNEEISIKEYLKDENKFLEFINKIIYNKPEKHNIIKNEKSDTKRNMYQIGG